MGDWLEWRERCALALCSAGAQSALMGFAAMHFSRLTRHYATRTNAPDQPPQLSGRETWHLFETHLAVRHNREGKRYKDWLFARLAGTADDELDVVAGGAALLMRDVVREHLRNEHSAQGVVSLSAPLAETGSASLTVEDLLPGTIDTADEVAKHEFEHLALGHAGEFFRDMDHREKVAVLAKSLGLSLADPAVEEVAGCRKSVLNTSYRGALERLAADLRRQYEEDDMQSVRILVLMTFEAVASLAGAWGVSERGCARLLSMAEPR
ncbi:MAG: hypothetical protein V1873_05090 [Verrucomicrobiota bacterium]